MSQLLERVRTIIRFRHLSLRTEESYIYWIKRFILFGMFQKEAKEDNSLIEESKAHQ